MHDSSRYADLSDDFVEKTIKGHELLAEDARARGHWAMVHYHRQARLSAIIELNLRANRDLLASSRQLSLAPEWGSE